MKIKDYWKTQPEKLEKDDIAFLQWFDDHPTIKSYWSSGFVDLSLRILKPEVVRQLGDISNKKCLEIGFGGGRILNAATCMFDYAYGVDIHNSFEKVEKLINNKNFKLLKPENINEIEEGSIDLIYSFIVFQHFESIEDFKFYIEQIKRILNPGGVFVIFYGINRYNNDDYLELNLQQIQERGSSLFIKPSYVNEKLKENNLKVIKHEIASKQPWFTAQEKPSNSQALIIGKK